MISDDAVDSCSSNYSVLFWLLINNVVSDDDIDNCCDIGVCSNKLRYCLILWSGIYSILYVENVLIFGQKHCPGFEKSRV